MGTITRESEAIARYRDLEEWFADQGLCDLANLCARLAAKHRDATHAVVAALPEFVFRLASPRQLLEIALAAEDDVECQRELEEAIGKLGPVDWQSAIDAGAVPGLALGADRRQRRPVSAR
jgi:hypothetical protein